MRTIAQWSWLFLADVVTLLLGLPLVAIAVFFPTPGFSVSDGRPIINAPKWLWLWGNDFDGYDGDRRGWWAENTPFGWPVTSKRARWWWGAIRNPTNNMRMLDQFSCPVAKCSITYSGQRVVEDKPGIGGWQFVTATDGKKSWSGFYYVKEFSGTRAFVIRLGFKIKPDHEGSDELPKGFTFKINPWKSI